MKYFILLTVLVVLIFNSTTNNIWAESKVAVSEGPPLLSSEIKKIPLPLDIRKSMWDICYNVDENGFTKEQKQFWQTLHLKLLSITPEFKSVKGKISSITVDLAGTATSCPPGTTMNGTFTSVNEKKHIFQLEYDGNTFRYQIDGIFPSQYESFIESPLKQFKSGIPIEKIQCKENLVLVIKASNGNLACVDYDSRTKLIERGWGKNSLYQLDNKTIIENVKDLEEVKTFLVKYPNADIGVERDSWLVYYSVQGILPDEPYVSQSRHKEIQIEIDPFGRPLWVGIECGGPASLSAQHNVIELLNTPDWCFPDVNEIKSDKTTPSFSYADAVKMVRRDLESNKFEFEKISFAPINTLFYTELNGTVFTVKPPNYFLDRVCVTNDPRDGSLLCGFLSPHYVDLTRGRLVYLIEVEYSVDTGIRTYDYLVDAKNGQILSGFSD